MCQLPLRPAAPRGGAVFDTEAEVRQLALPQGSEEYVLRLQVAINKPGAVYNAEGNRRAGNEITNLRTGK